MFSMSEVEAFVNPAVVDILNKNKGELFEKIKIQVLEELKSTTGIVPISPRPASLTWALLPCGWMIDYIALGFINSPGDDLRSKAEFKWREAHKILERYKISQPGGKVAKSGTIDGEVKI